MHIATSQSAADCIQCTQLSRLNENELGAIFSLLAFVAQNNNTTPEMIQEDLEERFCVAHVSQIERESFDNAIQFLMGLC